MPRNWPVVNPMKRKYFEYGFYGIYGIVYSSKITKNYQKIIIHKLTKLNKIITKQWQK